MIIVFIILLGVQNLKILRASGVSPLFVCGLVVDHFIFCAVCFVLTMCINIMSRHIIASSYAHFFDCNKIFCLILVIICI